ncbi:MAG TPA: hypothetical protein VG319_11775, partial [Polyangia bacterium]|nr:hypothetical protein [Polyangia bacterium]
MTRFVARSFFLIGAVAAGCAPQNGVVEPPGSGMAGSGPVVITGAAGLCGGGVASGGARAVFPGMSFPPGFGSPSTPQVGATHTAADAPPAISGGTLRIMADGNTAVAADPDRDQVYVVDLAKRTLTFTVALQHGDEPGRLVIDAAGRAHVALRRGGALVTIAPTTGVIVERRNVCAAPRGVAYDAANDLVHVACADGQLVSLPAAGGAATRMLQLDSDLRDVVVDGANLRVTRFRSAELLTVDATGKITTRVTPPPFRSVDTRGGQLFTASAAWRAMEMPTGGVVMVHQRGLMDDVQPSPGGYGGLSTCDAIVQTAVTVVAPGQDPKTGPAMAGMVVPADMAISADGNRVAIIAAGNATNSETAGGAPRLPRVFVTDMSSATDQMIGCTNDGVHGPCLPVAGAVAGPGVPVPPAGASGDVPAGADAGAP